MDVFRQRLEDEYDANIIVTAPTVPYKGGLCFTNSEDNLIKDELQSCTEKKAIKRGSS
jgi:translation elongation factor EF-4